MSGFSPEWLALREPADHAARSLELRDRMCAAFSKHDRLRVIDLGCGSGSNLRALVPHLPDHQQWRLIDHDADLLADARETLIAWADRHETQTGTLVIEKHGKRVEILFESADLSGSLDALLDQKTDLVTAAAFFDLVSASWIEAFCRALAARALPLFTVLTYNGEEIWRPAHAADAAMLAAFHVHQATDKGFGPAAGPRAVSCMREAFERQSYAVATSPSPWRLGEAQRTLMTSLADGIASAVGETGLVDASLIADWRSAHRNARACIVGHDDLWAVPNKA